MQSDMFDVVAEGLASFDLLFPQIYGKSADNDRKDRVVGLWAEQLDDLPPEVVHLAFEDLLKTHKPRFYADNPTPAMIRGWVIDRISQGSWAEAYAECERNWHKVMHPEWSTDPVTGEMVQRSVSWSNPVIEAAFKAFGGAREFSVLKEGDRTAQAQFRDIYNATKTRMQSKIVDQHLLSGSDDNITPLPQPRYAEAPRQIPEHIAERGKQIHKYLMGQTKNNPASNVVDMAVKRLGRHNMPDIPILKPIPAADEALKGVSERFDQAVAAERAKRGMA